jgi:hypothetical protein
MSDITRADIEAALRGATGNPSSGAVADMLNAMIDAVDTLVNPKPVVPSKAHEQRVVKTEETR